MRLIRLVRAMQHPARDEPYCVLPRGKENCPACWRFVQPAYDAIFLVREVYVSLGHARGLLIHSLRLLQICHYTWAAHEDFKRANHSREGEHLQKRRSKLRAMFYHPPQAFLTTQPVTRTRARWPIQIFTLVPKTAHVRADGDTTTQYRRSLLRTEDASQVVHWLTPQASSHRRSEAVQVCVDRLSSILTSRRNRVCTLHLSSP